MRFVAMIVLVVGVFLSGGAVYLAKDYYARYQAMLVSQAQSAPKTISVLAASKPLKYGDKINLASAVASLKWVTWPEDVVPQGAFTSQEDLLGDDGKATRVVLRAIEPGELVLKSKLSGFGENGNVRVAVKVAEGMRAFTISIDAVSGVAGLVAPGDRVDILLTRSITNELTTTIILQNVLVIATDQSSNTESTHAQVARTATVEVNPTDASKLALAQQVGRLSLSLRNINEVDSAAIEAISIDDLPAQPKKPEPAPVVVDAPEAQPQPEMLKVKVRKGVAVEVMQFEDAKENVSSEQPL